MNCSRNCSANYSFTSINWIILCKVYENSKRYFGRKKPLIIKFPNKDIFLNERSEFTGKCRRENKNLINKTKYFT